MLNCHRFSYHLLFYRSDEVFAFNKNEIMNAVLCEYSRSAVSTTTPLTNTDYVMKQTGYLTSTSALKFLFGSTAMALPMTPSTWDSSLTTMSIRTQVI